MAYPIQPPVENAYQVTGKALMQGGQVLESMRDMIEKRKQALIAQRQAEIEAQQKADALEMQKKIQEQTIASSKAEMDIKEKEEARKAQEAERQQNFRNIASTGKAIPVDYQTEIGPQLPEMEGSPLNRNVERKPFSREEYLDEALRAGAIDPEKYASATRETYRAPKTAVNEQGEIIMWDDERGGWVNTGERARQLPSMQPSYQSEVITMPDGSKKLVYMNPKDPYSGPVDPGINLTPPDSEFTDIPGLRPIPGVKITPKSIQEVKLVKQTYDDLKTQIKNYMDAYSKTGSEAFGSNAEALSSMQTGIQLSLKELEKLGALTGPDFMLMNRMVPSAGGILAKGRSLANPALGNKFYSQMGVLNKRLESKLNSAIKANGFEQSNEQTPNRTPEPQKQSKMSPKDWDRLRELEQKQKQGRLGK